MTVNVQSSAAHAAVARLSDGLQGLTSRPTAPRAARSTPTPSRRPRTRRRTAASTAPTCQVRSSTQATSTSSTPRSYAAQAACPSKRLVEGGVELSEGEVEAENEAEAEDALQEHGGPSGPGAPGGGGAGGGGAGGGGGGGEVVRPSGAPLRGGNKAIGFLRASWAELQRVQWPDRRQVTQATAVVLGFVAIAGLYLLLADTVAKEIVEFILG